MRLTFCFPGGKTKALTFSYDDGFAPDEKLVEIFNRHGMKATFNLNACRCGAPEEAERLKKRYAGHEIACHGKTHPFFERMPQMSFVLPLMPLRIPLFYLTMIFKSCVMPYIGPIRVALFKQRNLRLCSVMIFLLVVNIK